jgi:hypothetical protein
MKLKSVLWLFVGMYLNSGCFAQCACCSSPAGFSGGGPAPGSSVLGKGQVNLELYAEQRIYRGLSRDVLSEAHTVPLIVHNMNVATAIVRYGITSKVQLFVQQPVYQINTNDGSFNMSGDLSALAAYRVQRENNSFILQAGMKLPTAPRMTLSDGSVIVTGSGSYDPIAGFAFNRTGKRSLVTLSAFYKYATAGWDGIKYGSYFAQQAGVAYFAGKTPETCSEGNDNSVSSARSSANFILLGEWTQMQINRNAFVPNTGSYLLTANLGFTFAGKGFSVPVSAGVPLYSRYHGEQNKNSLRLRAGIIKTI